MTEQILQEPTEKAKEKLRTINWIHVIIIFGISGIIASILLGISIIPIILTGGLFSPIFSPIAPYGLKLAGAKIK